MQRGLLAFTLVLALLPLACGGGGAALAPDAAVAEAATKSLDAGSSRVDLELTMTGLGDGPVTITAEGVQDSEERLARFTFDLSEVGSLTGGGVALGEIEMLMDGSILYMHLPFLETGGLKPWVEIDLQALAREEGLDLPSLQQLSQTDPSQALRYLRATSDDIEEVGTEEVRGVETTRYRLTIDLQKVAAQASGEERAAVEELLTTTEVDTLPAEVWVDDDGLVRRLSLQYEGVEFGRGERGDMTLRMDLHDYGVSVNVSRPPADEVMTFDELLERAGEAQ